MDEEGEPCDRHTPNATYVRSAGIINLGVASGGQRFEELLQAGFASCPMLLRFRFPGGAMNPGPLHDRLESLKTNRLYKVEVLL